VEPLRAHNQLDTYADELRAKLPAAPEALTDFYVQWAPWIAMVFGALGILFSVGVLFLGALLTPFLVMAGADGVMAGASAMLALIVVFISSAAEALGGYLMRNRLRTGWWLVAAALVLGLLFSLLSMNVFSLAFNLLIAYIHLAVKPSYV
jgi:hypothetical protein